MVYSHLHQNWKSNQLHTSWIIVASNLAEASKEVQNFVSQSLLDAGQIDLLSHPDFKIVQRSSAAKSISVEQLREAQNFLYKTSGLSSNKVLVIEAADLMSLEAANSCLKILEDPPPNTYMFLLTEHIGKLLPTIRSRCAKYYESYQRDNKAEDLEWIQALTPNAEIESKLKIIKLYVEKDREKWATFARLIQNLLVKSVRMSVNIEFEATQNEMALLSFLAKLPTAKLLVKLQKIQQLVQDTIRYDLDLRASSILIMEHLCAENN